jgi:hypothetical protein
MAKRELLGLCALIVMLAGDAASQAPSQRPATPGPQLDLGAARRQAAELADIRAILNDPDANVRLLAIREIAARGNAVQRQVAIEAGLSSTDAVVQEMTLRMLAATLQIVVLPFVNEEGETPEVARRDRTSLTLSFKSFDTETGRFAGDVLAACNNSPTTAFTGQLTGNVLTFATQGGFCTGSLRWDPDRREFAGTVNLLTGRAEANRRVVWRPM